MLLSRLLHLDSSFPRNRTDILIKMPSRERGGHCIIVWMNTCACVSRALLSGTALKKNNEAWVQRRSAEEETPEHPDED